MYWSYEYISQKFHPGVKESWTVKEIVEKTTELKDTTYVIDVPTGTHISYEESNVQANRITHVLQQLGLQKGDRLGILMSNKPAYMFTLFAVGKGGFIEVPINTHLLEAEIAHIITKSEMSTLLVEGKPEFLQLIARVTQRTSQLKTVIIEGPVSEIPEMNARTVLLDEWIQGADENNPQVNVEPNDPFCIFFTSGTTGMPKGALLKNMTFMLGSKSMSAFPYLNHQSRNYTCLPLFHANAQLSSMTMMRCLGGSVALSNRFSPRSFWQEIIQHEASFFNSIGGMMQILDAAFEPHDVPDHPAKFVLVGGTPKELWQRFEQKFHVDVFEAYCMSENPVLFANIHPDPSQRKLGSFGKPVFWDLERHIKLVNDDNEEVVSGVGELVQTGDDFIVTEYWNAPEATREAIDPEGWFHSGDIVEKDEDGYYFFVDRKKFMIRVAGENVSAFEVEDIVNTHPLVEQSAAIPVPDDLRGEEIKVYVKLKENVSSLCFSELTEYCAKRLAYFKVPRYYELIEEFPVTATKRIQKAKLKDMEKERNTHGWDRNDTLPNWRQHFYGVKGS